MIYIYYMIIIIRPLSVFYMCKKCVYINRTEKCNILSLVLEKKVCLYRLLSVLRQNRGYNDYLTYSMIGYSVFHAVFCYFCISLVMFLFWLFLSSLSKQHEENGKFISFAAAAAASAVSATAVARSKW